MPGVKTIAPKIGDKGVVERFAANITAWSDPIVETVGVVSLIVVGSVMKVCYWLVTICTNRKAVFLLKTVGMKALPRLANDIILANGFVAGRAVIVIIRPSQSIKGEGEDSDG